MRMTHAFTLAIGLLASVPAFAGNLSFDGGTTTWNSTQCTKPVAPASVLAAHPETSGEDMNAMVAQLNNYIDAAQAYMNCISSEAAHDQTLVGQSIASSAQKDIGDMQNEADSATRALRDRQR